MKIGKSWMRFRGLWIKLVFSMNAFLTVVVATGLPKEVATTTTTTTSTASIVGKNQLTLRSINS